MNAHTVQSKGIQHCRDIRLTAVEMYKAYNYKKTFPQCLLEALRNHRLMILDLLEAEGQPMPLIIRKGHLIQQQQRRIPTSHIEQQIHMGSMDSDEWCAWRGEL